MLLLLVLLFFNKIFENDVGAISIDDLNGNGNGNGNRIYSSIHLVWFQSFDDNNNVSFDGGNDSGTSTDNNDW